MIKNIFILALTLVLSVHCYSQISYEEGYYIDNSDQKVSCFIKNVDWKNNPTEFEYKLSMDGESQKTNIKMTKEFGVNGVSKYIRRKVKMDRSGNNINQLSNIKKPIFKEEEVFLKVLVDGKAKLYSFEDRNLKRYFYSVDISEIEQLVFKKYWASEGQIGANNKFRQQLWSDVRCQNDKIKTFENIEYKKNDLVRRFLKYNECNGSRDSAVFEKEKKDLFNLTLRSGIRSSSLSINNTLSERWNFDFGNKLNFRFGIETEFLMPFNKSKWAIIVEPTYQYFKSEKENQTRDFIVDYKSIEIPIGIRHYLFLNDKSKIFINTSYVIDFNFDSTISNDLGSELEIKSGNNIVFGIGYKYKDRYSIECRYHTNRNVLQNYLFMDSRYKSTSLILGYTIF